MKRGCQHIADVTHDNWSLTHAHTLIASRSGTQKANIELHHGNFQSAQGPSHQVLHGDIEVLGITANLHEWVPAISATGHAFRSKKQETCRMR